jgi:hypothetical protein
MGNRVWVDVLVTLLVQRQTVTLSMRSNAASRVPSGRDVACRRLVLRFQTLINVIHNIERIIYSTAYNYTIVFVTMYDEPLKR